MIIKYPKLSSSMIVKELRQMPQYMPKMNTQLAFDLWRYSNKSLITLTALGTKTDEKRAHSIRESKSWLKDVAKYASIVTKFDSMRPTVISTRLLLTLSAKFPYTLNEGTWLQQITSKMLSSLYRLSLLINRAADQTFAYRALCLSDETFLPWDINILKVLIFLLTM